MSNDTLNANEPAFPVPDSQTTNGEIQFGSNGMTLRTYIATKAMQGLLADHKDHEDERRFHIETGQYDDGMPWRKHVFDETCAQAVARLAVEHADALIAALGGKQ